MTIWEKILAGIKWLVCRYKEEIRILIDSQIDKYLEATHSTLDKEVATHIRNQAARQFLLSKIDYATEEGNDHAKLIVAGLITKFTEEK